MIMEINYTDDDDDADNTDDDVDEMMFQLFEISMNF